MTYDVKMTSQFKKDVKRIVKQGKNIEEVKKVIENLRNNNVLDEKYRDHQLEGNKKKTRECHVENDLVLVYRKEKQILLLLLIRIGSHSEILEDISLKRF